MKRLIPAIAIILGWASAAWAAVPAPLTTLRAIHALSRAEAEQALPVAFVATVTYFAPGFRYLFVQDGGQAIFVFVPENTSVAPGDRVLIRGVTNAEFRPDVTSDSVKVLWHGALPQALPATFDDLMSGQLDCMWVTVRGKVRDANLVVRPDIRDKNTLTLRVAYIELLTDGGYIDVIVNSKDENALKNLLDADVEVTGAAGGIYDGKWHQTGTVIRSNSFSSVAVLSRAKTSPWALPITPMDKVLSGYHIDDLTRRVRVHGTITYYQPGYCRQGSAMVLQDGADSLWVESLTDIPLQLGDLANATGIPAVANGSQVLTHAEVEDTLTPSPVTPLEMTWEQLANANMTGQHHYDLVSIEGQVVTEAREASQDTYVLNADGKLFSAIFHHPDSTGQLSVPAMKQVPLGSTVRVTGICILQDAILFSGRAPFNILLRSFDDIVVVARPSWLSVRLLARIVFVLLLVVVAFGAWGAVLMRKVHRQTVAMADRTKAEAALERQRSVILEDINGTRPLAEIIEKITEMVTFMLNGAPCWCEIADGAKLGNCPLDQPDMRIVQAPIVARSGPGLGTLFAAFVPDAPPSTYETVALHNVARLATLAIESRRIFSDLRRRSEFDLLTDTHNRASLHERVELLIEEARRSAGIFGLICIDLDKFKPVNDRYGHHVGDLFLQYVALRMKQQLRSHDLLARLGGDEFAVLLPLVRSRSGVEEAALRLERCFDRPFEVEGYILQGAASLGIALYPEDGSTKDSLLSAADEAMYAAKKKKRKMEENLEQSQQQKI